MSSAWVNDSNAALLTDLYELTMLQSYFDEGMNGIAVFDLFVRRLSQNRNYFVACGLDHVLDYLEAFCFSGDAAEYLQSLTASPAPFWPVCAIFDLPVTSMACPKARCSFQMSRYSKSSRLCPRLKSSKPLS